MEYIKLYEDIYPNELEQYFKDKIDWKFFNYLTDRLLVNFEDYNIMSFIIIGIFFDNKAEYAHTKLGSHTFKSIYSIYKEHGEYSTLEYMSFDELIKLYEKYGIVYNVSVFGDKDNGLKFKNSIKHKNIESIEMCGHDVVIKLKKQ